jgi:hypothetical protein
MGVNATTFVPTYVSGEVLTAANLNVTNSGIPVFADSTARDAAFGGTGEKVLAEGQYAFLEDTNATQFYDGAAWQTIGGGFTLLSTTTLSGATTTVTISDFSYVALYGVVTGMTNATASGGVTMKPNNSATAFHGVEVFNSNGTAGTSASTNAAISFITSPLRTSANNFWQFYIYNYASATNYKGYNATQGAARAAGGLGTGGTIGIIQDNNQIASLVLANSGGDWSTGTFNLYGVK